MRDKRENVLVTVKNLLDLEKKKKNSLRKNKKCLHLVF